MTLQDLMKDAGWEHYSMYSWQHRDGRQLERNLADGKWHLLTPMRTAEGMQMKITKLGNSMKQAFESVLYPNAKRKARV